jgi:hypothetical protein
MKFLASLFTSLVLAFSVLIAPTVPANATTYKKPHKHHHKHPHPYPGSCKTESHYYTQSSVKKGRPVSSVANVESPGNAKPKGTIVVKVYYVKNGQYQLVRTVSKNYVGPHFQKIQLGSFSKTGLYATTMSFVPQKGSVYQPSSSGPNYFQVQ